MARAPPLYRVSRLLTLLGLVALVLTFAYVGLTVYSASQLAVGHGGNNSTATVADNTVTISSGLTLANHGILPITAVSIVSRVHYPDGSLLAVARSPTLSVAAGSNTTIPLTVAIPLTASSEATMLLTHSLTLPTNISANVTFGGILTLSVEDASTIDWGAPFDGLNATLGTPTPQANGTAAVPVQVTYTNRAVYDERGTLGYAVKSSSGATCATGSFAVNVPQGQSFNQGSVLYLSPSCNATGGTVDLTFTGSGFNLVLPPEAIP